MAMAAYIIGMQKIASLASPKKRVVERLHGSYPVVVNWILWHGANIMMRKLREQARQTIRSLGYECQ
jgi:hypothetical protein